jgi:predicted DNA-binding protein (UPF0251 family)
VAQFPEVTYFKPRGVPLALLERVDLTVDEFEALRLADLEGLYHEEAARRMNVSRQTFGRIVDGARRKVADALTCGKALSIAGGAVEVATPGKGRCRRRGRGRGSQP